MFLNPGSMSLPKRAGLAANKDAMHFPGAPPTRGIRSGCASLLTLHSTTHICKCAKSRPSPFMHPASVLKNLQGINFISSSVSLLGRHDPEGGDGIPAPVFACSFGFAAAFGFGTYLPFESTCVYWHRSQNLHVPSLLKAQQVPRGGSGG